MATRSKQPEVLRELFETLGNDPFVIAECLARPALAERLLTTSYAYDERFHGELGQRAEADLRAHHTLRQMKQTSGKYREIELVRSDSEGAPAVQSQDSTTRLKLNSREWQESIEKLVTQFDNPAPVGRDRRARRINRDAPGIHAPTDPSESAIIATLPPGNYTAIVRGTNSTTGVGLVEVYDLD